MKHRVKEKQRSGNEKYDRPNWKFSSWADTNGEQLKRNLANWKSNLSDFPRILQKKKKKGQERIEEMTQNMYNRSQNSNIYTEGCSGKNRKKSKEGVIEENERKFSKD